MCKENNYKVLCRHSHRLDPFFLRSILIIHLQLNQLFVKEQIVLPQQIEFLCKFSTSTASESLLKVKLVLFETSLGKFSWQREQQGKKLSLDEFEIQLSVCDDNIIIINFCKILFDLQILYQQFFVLKSERFVLRGIFFQI